MNLTWKYTYKNELFLVLRSSKQHFYEAKNFWKIGLMYYVALEIHFTREFPHQICNDPPQLPCSGMDGCA